MSQILTLDQMKTMSIDDIVSAYQTGYSISDNIETNLDLPIKVSSDGFYTLNPEIKSLQHYTTDISTLNPEIKSLQHYTTTDIGIIAAAIGISVGILGLFTYYYIKREEKRILEDVKESVLGSFGRYGPTALEKIAEKLAPAAERLAARILPEKKAIT